MGLYSYKKIENDLVFGPEIGVSLWMDRFRGVWCI